MLPLLPLQSQQSVGGVWAVIPTDVPKVLQSDRWHVWACLGTAELCWVGTDPVCAPLAGLPGRGAWEWARFFCFWRMEKSPRFEVGKK